MILLLLLAFLSLCAGIYYWFHFSTIQLSLTFLTESETQTILNNDADHYYDTFQKTDLKVRGAKSKQDYLGKISKSGCDGNIEIEEKITHCVGKLQTYMKQYSGKTIEGVSIDEWMKLPWKIGFICDKVYENGLPHTRGDVIILSNQHIQTLTIPEVCRLLLHEQTHVYQKKFGMSDYLQTHYDTVPISDKDKKRIPANPDTDGLVYKDKSSGKVFQGQYNKQPKFFRDITYASGDHTTEHPFEYMAYQLEQLFKE
jgi:hypothetical protein